MNVIGTCSICGGAVAVPAIWGGLFPPTPSCTQCGAVVAAGFGPVIPMTPKPQHQSIRYDMRPCFKCGKQHGGLSCPDMSPSAITKDAS